MCSSADSMALLNACQIHWRCLAKRINANAYMGGKTAAWGTLLEIFPIMNSIPAADKTKIRRTFSLHPFHSLSLSFYLRLCSAGSDKIRPPAQSCTTSPHQLYLQPFKNTHTRAPSCPHAHVLTDLQPFRIHKMQRDVCQGWDAIKIWQN